MSDFIQLTTSEGNKIYVRKDMVASVGTWLGKTHLTLTIDEVDYEIKETPEQVLNLLKETRMQRESNIITLHSKTLHGVEKPTLETINADYIVAVTEDYHQDPSNATTWVYLQGTCFPVKETREQILELLGWDRYNKQVKETT